MPWVDIDDKAINIVLLSDTKPYLFLFAATSTQVCIYHAGNISLLAILTDCQLGRQCSWNLSNISCSAALWAWCVLSFGILGEKEMLFHFSKNRIHQIISALHCTFKRMQWEGFLDIFMVSIRWCEWIYIPPGYTTAATWFTRPIRPCQKGWHGLCL